ncbi:hypothetical protein [Glutamicibacter sp. BSL13]
MEVAHTVVSFIAALLALFVTLDQLTSTTRIRRKVDLWRTEAEAKAGSYDAKIFWSLHRSGTAKLVALDAVPTKWIAFATLVTAILLWGVFTAAYDLGKISSDSSLSQRLTEAGIEFPSLLLTPVLATAQIYYLLHRTRERFLVEKAFLKKEPILRPIGYQETRQDSGAKAAAIAIISDLRMLGAAFMLSFGAIVLTSSLGYLRGSADTAKDALSNAEQLVFIAGPIFLVAGFVLVAPLLGSRLYTWVHTSMLPDSET